MWVQQQICLEKYPKNTENVAIFNLQYGASGPASSFLSHCYNTHSKTHNAAFFMVRPDEHSRFYNIVWLIRNILSSVQVSGSAASSGASGRAGGLNHVTTTHFALSTLLLFQRQLVCTYLYIVACKSTLCYLCNRFSEVIVLLDYITSSSVTSSRWPANDHKHAQSDSRREQHTDNDVTM